MLLVRVGPANLEGVVYMTHTQYLKELSKDGGKRYMDVYLKGGNIERFRIKYFREVEAYNGKVETVERVLG